MITQSNLRKFVSIALFSLFVGTGLLGLAGCDSTGPAEEGTLRLKLTDAPLDIIEEANVTIEQVSIISGSISGEEDTTASEQGEIITLTEETQQYNLLELQNGVDTLLAQEEIPAGSYSQIRLKVTDASLVLENGDEYTLGEDFKIPSGQQSGLKVLLPNFTVASDTETELTLDFDVEESFVVQGNPDTSAGIKGFIFKPTIKATGYAGATAEADMN